MPTAERERSGIPVQAQIRALFETLEKFTSKLSAVEEHVDSNDEEIREILASISGTVQSLKTMIYGNSEFRLIGIADKIQNIETDVRGMVDSRRIENISQRLTELEKSVGGLVGDSRRMENLPQQFTDLKKAVDGLVKDKQSLMDQLKGMKIALGLMGITGGGTLITVIMELLKP